jgi:hypothetical protein
MGKASDNTPSTVGILMRLSNGALIAERNRIRQAVSGIVVDDDPSKTPFSLSIGSRIAGNEISLVAGVGDGIAAWGIDVAAAQSIVMNNRVLYAGGRVTGIRVTGDASLVEGNIVTAKASALAVGIVAGFVQPTGAKPVDRVTVVNNTVQGVQNGIAIIGVTRATVSGNHLGEGAEGPAIGIALIDAVLAHVTGNIIAGRRAGSYRWKQLRARWRRHSDRQHDWPSDRRQSSNGSLELRNRDRQYPAALRGDREPAGELRLWRQDRDWDRRGPRVGRASHRGE